MLISTLYRPLGCVFLVKQIAVALPVRNDDVGQDLDAGHGSQPPWANAFYTPPHPLQAPNYNIFESISNHPAHHDQADIGAQGASVASPRSLDTSDFPTFESFAANPTQYHHAFESASSPVSSHLPIEANTFSPPSRPLDEADYRLLDSLSADLDQSHRAAPPAHAETGTSAALPHPPMRVNTFSSPPGPLEEADNDFFRSFAAYLDHHHQAPHVEPGTNAAVTEPPAVGNAVFSPPRPHGGGNRNILNSISSRLAMHRHVTHQALVANTAPPHSPIWEHPSSPPLGEMDYNILDSLSTDVAQHQQVAHHAQAPSSASTHSSADSVSSPPRPLDDIEHEAVRSPAEAPGRSNVVSGLEVNMAARLNGKRPAENILTEAEEKMRSRRMSARRTLRWPEATSLTQLDRHPVITGTSGNIYPGADTQISHRIIDDIFGGHLQWVSEEQMPVLQAKDYRRRSPFSMPSRVLPINTGQPMKVLMTEHNIPVRKGGVLAGTVLDGKPYYAFWGVPQNKVGKKLPITFYGVGVVDRGDEVKVDQWLGPRVEELKRLARG